jgi:hypothetical protein
MKLKFLSWEITVDAMADEWMMRFGKMVTWDSLYLERENNNKHIDSKTQK